MLLNPSVVINLSLKASRTTIIVPFSSPLPLELHAEIAPHVPHIDLKSYSLASRALNSEVNRVLWRSVAVIPRNTFTERIQAFANALMRDPRRAANIRNIKFVPCVLQLDPSIWKSILPDYPSEQFWSSLKEALRLLIRVERVQLFYRSQSVPDGSIGRLISIVGIVFQSCVARLDTNLGGAALHRLCGPGAWPALTTLSTGAYNSRSLIPFPPSALPQLLHVKSDRDSLIHIVPGRPIKTVYHDEPFYMSDGDLNALKRLQAVLQVCKTLRKARLCCAPSIDVTDFLTGFSHNNIRELYLFVGFKDSAYGDGHLLASLVMLALPPGFLQGFPKLESLQILMFHPDFHSLCRANSYSKDMKTVVEVLSTFLRLEHHSTLKGIDVDLLGSAGGSADQSNQNRGDLHVIATRRGNLWDVDVVNRDGSVMPRFNDML